MSRIPNQRTRSFASIVSILLVAPVAVALVAGPAAGHDDDEDERAHHQHGGGSGHLPASVANVELVSSLRLTDTPGGIADVAYHKGYAYLAAFRPECVSAGGTGTGVHVVDYRDPANPQKVAFIPAHANSYVGEGVHVFTVDTQHFRGDILVHNNEACDSSQPYDGGVSLWDVTDPANPQPLALGTGDRSPPKAHGAASLSHSAMGWAKANRAYVVMVDNQELNDVDILDVTDPRNPVLIAEVGWESWPGAHAPLALGENVLHHDMMVKKIRGHWYLLLSYWDAGYILLNVDDPANPTYVKDFDFPTPDPLTGFAIPEGNAHQAMWSSDSKFILATDEDFSPYRTSFEVTSGPHAGPYSAGQFSWAVPISERFPGGVLTGDTVFGGSGCTEDTNGNGVSDRGEVPSAASTGASIVVFERGTCFFSIKVESGEMAGYDAVIIGNSHAGARSGLLPDAYICGSRGHAYTPTVSAICVGHRATHLLFEDAPEYAGSGDLPAIGTLGASIRAETVFDGWGYVHLIDASTFREVGAYAVSEALDPAYAEGFGVLTVHEVKTDPRDGVGLAYLSYYDAGFRVVSFDRNGIREVGHYIAEGGNDFWGVFPIPPRANENPVVLLSDRDFGVWAFRYTGAP